MARILLHNAHVYVEKGVYEEAVLVEGGRIAKVGKNADLIAEAVNCDEVIDCLGRTLIPGLNDTHMHLFMFAESLNQAPIEGVESIDAMIEICKKFAAEHPAAVEHGIHAMGWNQDLFTSGPKKIPTREDLDKISTDYPIILERICGHIYSCNTKAIEMAGVTATTAQPPGGEFEIGPDGKPNGVFKEAATSLVNPVVPGFTIDDYHRIIQDAQQYAVEHGLTSINGNDIGTSSFGNVQAGFDFIKDMIAKDELKIRYQSQTSFKTVEQLEEFLTKGEFATADYGEDPLFTIGAVKMFRDGSLGGRTALLREGYVPDRDNHGIEWHSMEEMRSFTKMANSHGMPVVTHVIGDGAVESVLDAYLESDPENKCRNALIHCQITDAPLVEKILANNILVYAQPIFIDYDMTIVEPLCGPELEKTSYAFGTILKRGGHLSYGTDCPVESCNPFRNLYTAITRKGVNGEPEGGWIPSECVDRETAIDAYTIESAYAQFLEDRKGRIKEGYYADMVLLSKDIFTCPEREILDIVSEMTMVKGRVVYSR